MYPLLARIAPRRSAVVQASGDRYLPAAEARVLFGDDTGLRHFFRVEADNHRFGGGKGRAAPGAARRPGLDGTREPQRQHQ
jgi:hypothetical protein